jgi:hypothetical protein
MYTFEVINKICNYNFVDFLLGTYVNNLHRLITKLRKLILILFTKFRSLLAIQDLINYWIYMHILISNDSKMY